MRNLWKWLTGDGSINLAGYERTIDYSDYAIFGKSYAITLLYVVGNVVFGLVMNGIGAYCIFRQNKLRTFMTLFFVFSLMFNGGTVPTYMVIRTLGMTGTIWSLILRRMYQRDVHHDDDERLQAGALLHHRVGGAGRSRAFYDHV